MEKPYITDLVSKEVLQELQDMFVLHTGIAVGISAADGTYITDACGILNEFCEQVVKKSQEGKKRCDECDRINAQIALDKGMAIGYHCHAGLIDFTAPIIVGGDLYGFLVGGQVLVERKSRDEIYELAEELDVDKNELYEAYQNTKLYTREEVDKAIELMNKSAKVISEIAINKYNVLLANEEIEAAAKMKSDFLANMSHEIRTPMNAIIGMADMALREELPAEAESYVKQIKRSGKSLLAIINDILDFSKIESGKMDISLAEYSPNDLVNDVASILSTRIAGKPVELIIDISPNVPSNLMGDDNRIKQIITNIGNNAVKFTNEGHVKISVDCVATAANMYELHIEVADTGIGIKENDLKKIFESFQQVDSKRNRNIEGTGLGLAITKRLLELMNGTISVESEYEVGSTFRMTIPQLCLNYKPAKPVNEPEKVHAINMLENIHVREQLNVDFTGMQVEHTEIHTVDEVSECIKDGMNYLFIDSKVLSDELVNALGMYDNLKVVALLGYQEEFNLEAGNLVKLRKPCSAYNVIKVFNNEDVTHSGESEEVATIDFIAPDAKVLIVDDNEVNLAVAAGLLKPLKMQVDTCLSGKDAINKIGQIHYDLIFMDHMMPQMDGIETTRIIRRMFPDYDNVPIIALTANALEEAKSMFLIEGMNDFLAKPIDLNLMLQMLRTWLRAELMMPLDENEQIAMQSENEIVIDIPELDVEQALSLIGSKEIYLNTLESYYKSIDKKKNAILSAYETKDWHTYTIEVHALKSASRQIGAMKLGDLAASLERAGNKEQVDIIEKYNDTMLQEYDDIKEVLSKHIHIEETVESEEVAANDVILGILDNMSEALQNLDSTTMEDCVIELKKYKYDEDIKDLLVQLSDACEMLDIDTCEAIVSTWKSIIE